MSIVDEAIREALSRDIYEKRRSEVGSTTANAKTDDTDDEDLIGYDSIEPGLPPASSDRRKWWLDNSQPARSALKPPQNGAIPNPNRPSNPYTLSDEPDWVTVPRMPAPRGSQANSRSSNSPATNGPRKLPPPFNPNSSVSSLTEDLSQASLNDVRPSTTKPIPPPKPADRRLSTSTNSSTSKKAAPPVARKPVHLTSSPSSTSTPTLATISLASRVPQQSPQKPRQTSINHTGFTPPPMRAGPGSTPAVGAAYGKGEVEKRDNTPPPPPQPRRAGKKVVEDEGPRPSLPPRPRDLLGDDTDELNGWEALKPS